MNILKTYPVMVNHMSEGKLFKELQRECLSMLSAI